MLLPFYPFLTAFAIVVFLVYWVWVAAYLATAGSSQYILPGNGTICSVLSGSTGAGNTNCTFAQYLAEYGLRGMEIYHLFGLLWTMNFIVGFGQVVIAGSVATYYWTMDKKHLPLFPIWNSWKARRLGRYAAARALARWCVRL